MLDTNNSSKQAKRTHLCVRVEIDKNHYYIPLRNNLGDEMRKFGRIGHAVPSASRPNAGLDYRYALIVNDETYIEVQTERKIPASQYRIIKSDYEKICAEFEVYLKGFMRSVRKKRQHKEPLYRESCLVNYLSELGL